MIIMRVSPRLTNKLLKKQNNTITFEKKITSAQRAAAHFQKNSLSVRYPFERLIPSEKMSFGIMAFETMSPFGKMTFGEIASEKCPGTYE